jgi:hypothetical protein
VSVLKLTPTLDDDVGVLTSLSLAGTISPPSTRRRVWTITRAISGSYYSGRRIAPRSLYLWLYCVMLLERGELAFDAKACSTAS